MISWFLVCFVLFLFCVCLFFFVYFFYFSFFLFLIKLGQRDKFKNETKTLYIFFVCYQQHCWSKRLFVVHDLLLASWSHGLIIGSPYGSINLFPYFGTIFCILLAHKGDTITSRCQIESTLQHLTFPLFFKQYSNSCPPLINRFKATVIPFCINHTVAFQGLFSSQQREYILLSLPAIQHLARLNTLHARIYRDHKTSWNALILPKLHARTTVCVLWPENNDKINSSLFPRLGGKRQTSPF